MSTLENIYSYSHCLPYHTVANCEWKASSFPPELCGETEKAFPVEMKAESPGRKGDRVRKVSAGEAMWERDARSKVPNADSIFFKSLKGFSMGWSSGQMAACRKLTFTWSWEQRLSNSTWEAQVEQKPCGKLPNDEPKNRGWSRFGKHSHVLARRWATLERKGTKGSLCSQPCMEAESSSDIQIYSTKLRISSILLLGWDCSQVCNLVCTDDIILHMALIISYFAFCKMCCVGNDHLLK